MRLSRHHLHRYRQVVEVLTRHGFGVIVAELDLHTHLNLPRRLRRRQSAETTGVTPAQHIHLALEELGPTFIKLGQILSTRTDLLPPNFISELSRLQDDVAPAPWPAIKTVLETELGAPVEQFFQQFDQTPLAAASLGQVHAAILFSGEQVVVKVQRPDIERIIELDLDILRDLAQLAQERTPLGKHYELVELAEEFAISVRAELDYRREGRNADRFRANFAGEPHLYVPRVYWEHTTRRVLVQERLSGIKINDITGLDAAGYDRRRLAVYSAHFIIKEILEDGFFHADPHPGNLVVMPGEVIGLMDFGIVGHLPNPDRNNLVRLFVEAVQLDATGVVAQLMRMEIAAYNVDRLALQHDLRRLLLRYHGATLAEISAQEILEGIEPIIYRHHLRLPTDLWLLIKALVVMEGVGRNLDPDFDMFEVARPYIRQVMTRLWLPSAWGPTAVSSFITLADLLSDLPRQTSRILGQVERGDLRLRLQLPQLEQTTHHLEGIANRLILALLLAALILGLAWLIPTLNLTWPWGLLTWIIIAGFTAACVIAIALIWSILRSSR